MKPSTLVVATGAVSRLPEAAAVMRRLAVALSALLLLIPAAGAVSAARPVLHISEQVDETYQENICGIDVTTHDRGHVNVFVFEDGSVRDTTSATSTLTNSEGDWLEIRSSGRVVESATEEDGILTLTTAFAGVQERLRTSDGITRAFDRGRVVFRTVIDTETGDVLSFDISFLAGPHPEADSEFARFCEVVIDALG